MIWDMLVAGWEQTVFYLLAFATGTCLAAVVVGIVGPVLLYSLRRRGRRK